MKSEMNWRNKERAIIALWVAVVFLVMLVIVSGCGTVTPKQVTSAAASFDGSERNSGFIGWTTNGFGIITPHARDRYNALIADYGVRFHPPLKPDYGITPTPTNTFTITPEALSDFATMNRWRRNEAK